MSNPNEVITVALSRGQINELLAQCYPTDYTPELFEAKRVLQRAVRPAQASNNERVKPWGSQ
jgi:hypothetical protein